MQKKNCKCHLMSGLLSSQQAHFFGPYFFNLKVLFRPIKQINEISRFLLLGQTVEERLLNFAKCILTPLRYIITYYLLGYLSFPVLLQQLVLERKGVFVLMILFSLCFLISYFFHSLQDRRCLEDA